MTKSGGEHNFIDKGLMKSDTTDRWINSHGQKAKHIKTCGCQAGQMENKLSNFINNCVLNGL